MSDWIGLAAHNLEQQSKLYESEIGVCAVCMEFQTGIRGAAGKIRWYLELHIRIHRTGQNDKQSALVVLKIKDTALLSSHTTPLQFRSRIAEQDNWCMHVHVCLARKYRWLHEFHHSILFHCISFDDACSKRIYSSFFLSLVVFFSLVQSCLSQNCTSNIILPWFSLFGRLPILTVKQLQQVNMYCFRFDCIQSYGLFVSAAASHVIQKCVLHLSYLVAFPSQHNV